MIEPFDTTKYCQRHYPNNHFLEVQFNEDMRNLRYIKLAINQHLSDRNCNYPKMLNAFVTAWNVWDIHLTFILRNELNEEQYLIATTIMDLLDYPNTGRKQDKKIAKIMLDILAMYNI